MGEHRTQDDWLIKTSYELNQSHRTQRSQPSVGYSAGLCFFDPFWRASKIHSSDTTVCVQHLCSRCCVTTICWCLFINAVRSQKTAFFDDFGRLKSWRCETSKNPIFGPFLAVFRPFLAFLMGPQASPKKRGLSLQNHVLHDFFVCCCYLVQIWNTINAVNYVHYWNTGPFFRPLISARLGFFMILDIKKTI